MSTLTFDTHQFVKKLQAVGFSEEQAELFASEQKRLIEEQLVSKEHFDMKLKELEYSLTIKLGLMLAASMALIVGILKIA
ncbi:DUF1640 domain-containing protein [Ectothiorhodospiraceae bacterium BW-2]|nr:DUF1640 domain-containing protein [Ectothiorhodospiraceae bacterium BW-2]QEP43554.1 DUF1640 domain-containing protein [Ectothiorhodospiraceae bacterium BW-2]